MRFNTLLALTTLLAAFCNVQMGLAQVTPLKIPKEDVAAFVDGMLDIQMKRDDAAGAAVYLSAGDEVLISEGYGSAHPARKLRMSDNTVVRAGGVAMAVIAVAVMQQVEAGKLSLDGDIARAVDLPLPARADGPMTLAQLLSHTAGLVGGDGRGAAMSLREYLSTALSAQRVTRAYPAGRVSSFSPWGMALAAYSVERASGEPFDAYVERHIFAPIGMSHSTLRQPLPPELEAEASRGFAESTRAPLAFEQLAPSLALSTSAADMGRFGAMLVHHGTSGAHSVLSASSVDTLLARHAPSGLSTEVPAMAFGFHQVWFNGHRYFGIAGDTAAFHCELEVDVPRGTVLFVVYNSDGHRGSAGEASKLAVYSRGELIHGIFDRYEPFHPTVKTLKPTHEQQEQITGTWMAANWIAAKDAGMVVPAKVLHSRIDPADGTLVIDRFISDRDTVKHWAMIGDGLWQQYPQDRICFIPGKDGLPDRLALAADPATQWLRIPNERNE